jgi:hypothetical protein
LRIFHATERKTRIVDRRIEAGMCHTNGALCNIEAKQKPIKKNLCEIQWNKNENTERRDIVNLHADDLQIRFHSKESERKNVFCIQLGPLILFNVERNAGIRLADLRGNIY